MKKLLTIAIASASVAAVAATFSPTIGVNTLDLSKKNNIIPVQFTSLESSSGAAVKASALVCTNNIPVGSHLYVFQEGRYTGWELKSTGWAAQTTVSTADGISSNIPAEDQTLATGTAIWLSFAEAPKSAVSVAFYGQYTNTLTSTIAANATSLICNPKDTASSALAGVSAVNGDKVLPIGATTFGYYQYVTDTWYFIDKSGYKAASLPSLDAYQGVWYVSKSGSAREISW